MQKASFSPPKGEATPQEGPKAWAVVLARGQVTLNMLTKSGLNLEGKGAEKVIVGFEALGKPGAAREGTGWQQVKVRSSLGAVSTLLYEGDGSVSGFLRLKR